MLSLSLFLPLFHYVQSYNTLRSSTITFSTNLLLLAAPPPPSPSSILSSPLRIYHHFPIFLVITCMGYPWTSLMRKHVTSDSRTNHNRDTSISLRLFDKRSLATSPLTKSRSSALSNRRRPHLRTVPSSRQAACIPYWSPFCRTKPEERQISSQITQSMLSKWRLPWLWLLLRRAKLNRCYSFCRNCCTSQRLRHWPRTLSPVPSFYQLASCSCSRRFLDHRDNTPQPEAPFRYPCSMERTDCSVCPSAVAASTRHN